MVKNSIDFLEEVRCCWEDMANLYLERAGINERIDHRSLKDQEIDREPTIHIGPKATAIDRLVDIPPVSRTHTRSGWQCRPRTINYPHFDRGRTRAGYNRRIQLLNWLNPPFFSDDCSVVASKWFEPLLKIFLSLHYYIIELFYQYFQKGKNRNKIIV